MNSTINVRKHAHGQLHGLVRVGKFIVSFCIRILVKTCIISEETLRGTMRSVIIVMKEKQF